MAERSAGASTRAVHAGERRDPSGALEPPLVLSSAYEFESAEQAAAAVRGDDPHYVYGRWKNPSVDQLEAKLAALEGAEAAVCTASGMAAVAGVLLTFLSSGDHVVAPLACYGESSHFMRERLPRFGITSTFVDATDVASYERAIGPSTRVAWAETPANPNLAICDLAELSALCRRRGVLLVVDNTFATPICQQPLALGADLVVHSLTKALSGHGDAIGGVVCGQRDAIHKLRELSVKALGGVLAPFNAFLIARGLKTLALRQRQACASARAIAEFLQAHAAVARVFHPSLPSHPGHAVAARQMQLFGALVSFELAGGLTAGRRLLEAVELVTHAVSLGDARSLITHPASTTAANMPAEVRAAAGITDGLIRLSVGIEDSDDLIADLTQALGNLA